jgi:MFS family permease
MGTLSLGFSEKLIMRFGPRQTLMPGLVLIGLGLLLFARTPVDGNYATDILPPMLIVGIGIGTSFPSLMTLAMSGATPQDAGLASGVVNTAAQVGGAIGLAVLATLATERTDGLLDEGSAFDAALNSGFHLAYLVGAALVAGALAIAVFVMRSVPAPSHAPEGAQSEHGAAEPAYSEVS